MTTEAAAAASLKFLGEADLKEQCSSPEAEERKAALWEMRRQIEAGADAPSFFDLAYSLIEDVDNDCRWQAIIVVGECVEPHPEKVWPVIQEFGVSDDEDMRAAVATVLLEEMLDY